jgi:hypothetical protein
MSDSIVANATYTYFAMPGTLSRSCFPDVLGPRESLYVPTGGSGF